MINQADINIRDVISTTELFIMLNCTARIMMITGIQITTQELRRNLHLITACLSSHLIVNHKLERANPMLFMTASQAE